MMLTKNGVSIETLFKHREETHPDNQNTSSSVILVCPPFAPIYTPSLALSLLKEIANERGVKCSVFYSNLELAALIGQSQYDSISAGYPSTTDMAGEWIFSDLIYDEVDSNDDFMNTVILNRDHIRSSVQKANDIRLSDEADALQNIKKMVSRFINEQVEKILALNPILVGFTSVFQQTAAGLAIALKLKKRRPSILTVFGGANFESPMGQVLLAHFPQIDIVVSGEGEKDFAKILDASRGEAAERIVKIIAADNDNTGLGELDGLPIPDFTDYFRSKDLKTDQLNIQAHLVMETSRGCWWGQRSHCTFCGLNGAQMRYRTKSSKRAIKEIDELIDRHGNLPLDTVDNILSLNYFHDFLPEIEQKKYGINIFFETKSNLSKDKLRQLQRAGVLRIQPGIESISDEILKLMRKGVKGIHNIQTIKWCQELGINMTWNLLWGFPGENANDYDEMVKLVPLLEHLTPPSAGSQIRLDRFSPLFERHEEFGITNVEPYPAYHFLFRNMTKSEQFDAAYYFTFQYSDGRDVNTYTANLALALAQWQKNSDHCELLRIDVNEETCLLFDTRYCRKAPAFMIGGKYLLLLNLCEKAMPLASILTSPPYTEEVPVNKQNIETMKILETLCEKNLMVRLGQSFLSLPLLYESCLPNNGKLQSIIDLINELGGQNEEGNLTIEKNKFCVLQ